MGANIKMRFGRKKFMVNHAKKNTNQIPGWRKLHLYKYFRKCLKEMVTLTPGKMNQHFGVLGNKDIRI